MVDLSAHIKYFAYGSNLSFSQMKDRCPGNLKIGMGVLEGYRWIISTRGVANVVKSPDDYVLGKVYNITESDKSTLYKREGVAKKCYEEKQMSILVDGDEYDCLVYVDPIIQEGIPDFKYISKINEGIADSKLPENYVETYLREKIPLNDKSF